jgi:hypothetical protein
MEEEASTDVTDHWLELSYGGPQWHPEPLPSNEQFVRLERTSQYLGAGKSDSLEYLLTF